MSYQRLTGASRRSLGKVTALHSLKNVVLGDLLSYTYNSRSASSYWRAFSCQIPCSKEVVKSGLPLVSS